LVPYMNRTKKQIIPTTEIRLPINFKADIVKSEAELLNSENKVDVLYETAYGMMYFRSHENLDLRPTSMRKGLADWPSLGGKVAYTADAAQTSTIHPQSAVFGGATICIYSELAEGVIVRENAVIGMKSKIGPNTEIGEGTIVGNNVQMEGNSVIGCKCLIPNNSIVPDGTNLGPGETYRPVDDLIKSYPRRSPLEEQFFAGKRS
jgi:NDP-sugar pyrophosphorylase family protein